MKRLRSLATGAAVLLAAAIPAVSHAAQLYFEPVTEHSGPGFTVHAVLQIDRAVNALEGILQFDPAVLAVRRLNASPSGTPLWITEPRVSEAGSIAFAGIFPGGIEPRLTDRFVLMEVVFEALSAGKTKLSFGDVRVLLHSESLREDEVTAVPMTAILTADDVGEPLTPDDRIAPEPFQVSVAGGERASAVFVARDLQTGVGRYELRERRGGVPSAWREISSPASLSAWWRLSILEVRATDYAGNSRVARFVPGSLKVVFAIVLAGLSFGMFRLVGSRRRRYDNR